MPNKGFYILVAILFYACVPALNADKSFADTMRQRSTVARQLEEHADSINCIKDNQIPFGAYSILNNLWGDSNLKQDTAQLCIYTHQDSFGWKWIVPRNAKGIIGYPSIRVGPGPWNSSKDFVNNLPKQLADIHKLTLEYDTEIVTQHKTYNLSIDLWLNAEVPIHQNNISTEIMVWEDYYAFKSFGKKVDEITTDFGTYNVMKGYLKNKDFYQDWQYYAFIRQTPRQSGSVDLKVLLDYLIKHSHLSPNLYLSSIEFGNEIGDSSGYTFVKNFEVRLN